jgi:copper(I)-binding protein
MKTTVCIFVAALSLGTAAAMAQSSTIKIEKPWTRATAPGAAVGGGFATIRNSGKSADRLVSAASPVSASVELHEMAMDKDVMKMREVKGMEVPAGGVLELKPGSYHLMFINLKAPLKQGDKVPVTLKFEKAGEVKVELAVESLGASAAGAHSHGDMKKH